LLHLSWCHNGIVVYCLLVAWRAWLLLQQQQQQHGNTIISSIIQGSGMNMEAPGGRASGSNMWCAGRCVTTVYARSTHPMSYKQQFVVHGSSGTCSRSSNSSMTVACEADILWGSIRLQQCEQEAGAQAAFVKSWIYGLQRQGSADLSVALRGIVYLLHKSRLLQKHSVYNLLWIRAWSAECCAL
jgi:hypothetical protein